jgi:alpha-ketoglutarate-dependent taurine dioxygenase
LNVFDTNVSAKVKEQQMKAVRQALVKHSVLLVRGVTSLNEEQLVDFSRFLGPLEPPPASEVSLLVAI